MWKFITCRHHRSCGARCARSLAAAALILMTSTPSHAAVEYVKVCSLYGAGFFYIPGTDTCMNANQILADQFALARELTRAATGSAMATSLVNPLLPDGTNYAISTHWAVFDGQHAVGVAGLVRISGQPRALCRRGGRSRSRPLGQPRPIVRRPSSASRSRRSPGATCAYSDALACSIRGDDHARRYPDAETSG